MEGEEREMENEACACEGVKVSQNPNAQTKCNTDLNIVVQVEPLGPGAALLVVD